ncbi:KPN_02809 family neutral zinc metallopeptidase [Profundibacter sp.]|uniref:KPN_02809 family neutral zinc metallopeptidase n=1 Tax=Profundibacter sp. TaxID=3101071 RepID=UPI003D0F6B36
MITASPTFGHSSIGALIIVLIGAFMGVDVSSLLNNPAMSGGQIQNGGGGELTEADKRAGEFVSVVLADTEDVWSNIFREQVGQPYHPVTLVLFKGATQSACGGANGATGPFYCPGDKKVFLDTAFFTTLSRQMGAKGDFASAYVVAHEVAHHVQDELGILGKANRIRQQVSKEQSNAISVRIELQADCYSGIWARHAKEQFGSVERGDIAEAMNAAKQIGDDTLQRNAGRRVMPHTFTHGTSEQRQRWFYTGYESGELATCDTFGTDNL